MNTETQVATEAQKLWHRIEGFFEGLLHISPPEQHQAIIDSKAAVHAATLSEMPKEQKAANDLTAA